MKLTLLIKIIFFLFIVSCSQTPSISSEEKKLFDILEKIPFVEVLSPQYLMNFSTKVGGGKYLFKGQKVSMRVIKNFNKWVKDISLIENKIFMLEPSMAGFAAGMYDDSRVSIYLDADRWYNYDEKTKELVIYHELAHDYFNAEHSNKRCDIMNSSLNDGCYQDKLKNMDLHLLVLGKKYLKW